MANVPIFSVIVCNFNGVARIPATLRSLERLDYPKSGYEIIVVDDCSTDNSVQAIKKFRRVRLVKHTTNQGVSAARNSGVAAAKGTYVAFIDDDCTADKRWLKELETTLKEPDTIGAGGLIAAKSQKHLVQQYLIRSGYGRPAAIQLGQAKSPWARLKAYITDGFKQATQTKAEAAEVCEVYGANAVFPREELVAAGGFPTDLRTSEDAAICNRLKTEHPDKAIRFNPRAKVKHDFTSSFAGYLRKIYSRQGDTLQYYRSQHKTPPLFPFPLAVVGLALLSGVIAWWLVPLTFVILPLLVYSWWAVDTLKHRRIESLAFAYMQFLEETTRDAGLVRAMASGTIVRLRQYAASWGLAGMLGVGIAAVHQWHLPWLSLPVAFASVAIPGYLAWNSLGLRPHAATVMKRLALSTVLGIALVTLIGLAGITLLPLLGVTKPLASMPLYALYGGIILVLAAMSAKQSQKLQTAPNPLSFDYPRQTILAAITAFLLPIVALLGATMLNNDGSNLLAIIMLVAAACLLAYGALRAQQLPASLVAGILFSVSLAALWSYTARSAYVFGWDIQQEFDVLLRTQAFGAWSIGGTHDPYGAMLSLTVFPTLVSEVSNLASVAVFKLLFPVFFSFTPVMLYYLYRLCTQRWIAFVGAVLFISQFYYLQQFSALCRQQIAFLFFASLLYVLFQNRIRGKAQAVMVTATIFGLVTAHYSTTYMAIALLAGAFISTKLASWLWQGRFMPAHHIKAWVVLALIGGTVVWYGPATHSSALLQALGKSSTYAQIDDWVIAKFTAREDKQKSVTDDTYFERIGSQYHEDRPYIDYYPQATNDGLRTVSEPTHRGLIPILRPLLTIADTVLSYAWWILGALGICWGALQLRKRFVYEDAEAIMLALVAVVAFVLIHVIPDVGAYYNIPRLNQQALMFVALPAIMTLSWLLLKITTHGRQIITGTLVIAFGIASGIGVVVSGGIAPANLYNSGTDYERFYIHSSEVAAAKWLDAHKKGGQVAFADRYASLRLTVPTDITEGVVPDITPETLGQTSYVYASYVNTVHGVTMASADGTVIRFTFPDEFIEKYKNTLYSNGTTKVYR